MLDFLRSAVLAAALMLAPCAAAAQSVSPPAREPRPALWLLADEDTKIYLFGTIHVLPPGFAWRSAEIDRVIAEADELALETQTDPEGDFAAALTLFLEKPVPILKRVPPDRRKTLKRAIAESGLPRKSFDSMRTWAAAMIIGLGPIMREYGADDDPAAAPGADDTLEAAFKAAGKRIVSVEDFTQVLDALNRLPEPRQLELLLGAIDEVPPPAVDAEDHVLWASGEADRMDIENEAGMTPALYELLVTRRNAAWTDWLVSRLEKPGTVLFAVGAGHLAGRDSLQKMLADRGLEAKRID